MRLLHDRAVGSGTSFRALGARSTPRRCDNASGESRPTLHLLVQKRPAGFWKPNTSVGLKQGSDFIDHNHSEHRIGIEQSGSTAPTIDSVHRSIEAEAPSATARKAQGWRIVSMGVAHPEEVVAQIRALLEHSASSSRAHRRLLLASRLLRGFGRGYRT